MKKISEFTKNEYGHTIKTYWDDEYNYLKSEKHYNHNYELHSEILPAVTYYHNNGVISEEIWIINNDQWHREKYPAYIKFDINGNILHTVFYVNNECLYIKNNNEKIKFDRLYKFYHLNK